ncbi:MAG: LAGLIDADG family homing endonuclease [Candidatus Omnitrophota bacterium]
MDTFYSCTLCIPKGELVTLSDGSFDRIENIIRVAAEEEDIDVFSLKNPHFGAMPVGELFIHPAPKKITHIMMSNNNLLRLTANHKVLVDRNEGLMWIEAGKLKKEDRLLSAKTTCLSDKEQRENTPVFLIDLLPDEMKVFDNKFLLKLKKAMIEKYGSFGAAAGELGFGYHKLYTAFYFPCKRIYRLGFRRLTIGEIKLICSRIGWVWNEIKGEIKKFGVSRASGYELRKSVIDEDIMYLAGLIASDGCVRHRGKGTSVQFTNSEKALIDEFGRIIKDIFGVLPKTYKVKPIVSSSKGLTITGKKNIYVSQVNNSLIGRFMLSLGIGSKRGKGKKTASWMGEKISKSHPKLVCAFIKGLFDGDGHVTENHVLITTGTYAEAQHLFLLYKKAGISTYITEIKRGYQVGTRSFGDYTRFREIISSNHPAKKKIMHAVVPSFDDNHVVRVDAVPFKCGGILKQLLEKYKKNIEITKLAVDYKTIETWIKKKSRASKAKLSLLLESLKNKICKDDPLYLELLEWTRSNVIFEKVKSVKMAEYEEKEVYNFSVPGTHNYLVNGIVLKNCQSFAPNHVCIVKPERLGLCGAYNWLDAKASYELNPVGPNQPVKKGECLSAEKGEWKGVNDFIYQKSNKSLERFYAYSIIEWPETSCGCFECIIALVPEANGFMVVNREYSGMTPVGMKFTTLAGSVGGGAQTPGFMGIGRLYIVSKKFVKADGGLKRLVWMPKELKEALYDKLKKRGEEEGVADFVEKIADETNAVTSEELLAHLEKVGHPALTMDALI